jgi:hypothetical protein
MEKGTDHSGKNLSYLLTATGLVAILLACSLLLARADAAGTAGGSHDAPQASEQAPALSIQSSDQVSETVYLPLISHSFPPPMPVFGVQMLDSISDAQGLTQAVEAQVRWVRFAAFDWSQIEPLRTEPATYHWDVVDGQSLIDAAANDMEVMAIVRFAPPWAQKLEGYYCGPIAQDRLDEYAQFLYEMVRIYSLPPYNVRYWELGNEPDISSSLVSGDSGFGCWGDENDPFYGGSYYGEMLKQAYPAIKAADADAQVFIGGLLLDCDPTQPGACTGIHGDLPPKFLEGILMNGGGDYFDGVSFHAYSYYNSTLGLGHMVNPNWPGSETAIPEKTGFVRDVLARYGHSDKRLVNSESALLCYSESAECLETQAIYMPRAYAEALALDLDAQFHFAMINQHWRHTGLLLPDLTPKQAYHAYKTAASFLTSAVYTGPAAGYPAGIEGYTFLPPEETSYLDVIWSVDGSLQDVTLPAGAAAYDRYGVLVASSGTIQVNYGAVYVVRP